MRETPDAIREKALIQLDDLAARKFDWDGRRSLPMRQDVYQFTGGTLLAHLGGLDLGAGFTPAFVLRADGTLDILAFGTAGRHARLRVLCGGVVGWLKNFGDGITTIVGHARCDLAGGLDAARTADAVAELNGVIAWAAGESPDA